MLPTILDLASVQDAYRAGLSPLDLVEEITARCMAADDPAIFIALASPEALRDAAQDLLAKAPVPNSLPLWGIPFAAKDNIDVAGLPTTAACPAFAYHPEDDATVVARLRAAGAIVIGKTNLDQFATGLNGTRSPHGAPRSVFDRSYVSGGSSSGSAVAVASGLASFSLGTDTAGSGRVPAAFNNLVGIKPTPGLVPNVGVVPACRSVDVVTVFAATVGDGIAVRQIMEGYDARDPFSLEAAVASLPSKRPRIGVLDGAEREFYGNRHVEALYDAAIDRGEVTRRGHHLLRLRALPKGCRTALQRPLGCRAPGGSQGFPREQCWRFRSDGQEHHRRAKAYDAVAAFEGKYRLAALRQKTRTEWEKVDFLMLPTSPTTYTVEEMQADPIVKNSHFGRYTNFANLLDCAAIAIPAGFGADGHLPAGVMLVGPAFTDDALAPFADAMHRVANCGMGKDRAAALPEASRVSPTTDNIIPIVVVGAHLTDMPLNHELTAAGGYKLKACRTDGSYRLFALPGTTPPKPGLVRDPGFTGNGIEVEVWALPPAAFGKFVQKIPAPLGVGKITLDDGDCITGFLCEGHAIIDAREITEYGGWRNFLRAAGPSA